MTHSGDWSGEFTGLDVYSNGEEIVYTVYELDVPNDYTVSYDGTTITNTHTASTISVTVSKVWDDGDDKDGIRPTEVIVHLLANGSHTGKTVTLNAENNWSATWSNLDIKHNGDTINYTVWEEAVSGYTAHYTREGSSITITNIHVPVTVDPVDPTPTDPVPDGPPPTGDTLHMYFLLMILCMAGVLVLCVANRKKRKNH